MDMTRIASLFAVFLLCCTAHAQPDYPNKPVRLITPFNPGGAIDIYSRLLAEPLAKRLGQNEIVVAIACANTIVCTQQLVRAAADGDTFMVTTMSTTVNNRILFTKLPYDPDKDLAPITQLSYGTVLFTAPGNAPYSDLKGF